MGQLPMPAVQAGKCKPLLLLLPWPAVNQAGGAGNFTRNVNQAAMKTGNIAGAGTGSAVGNIGGKLMGK